MDTIARLRRIHRDITRNVAVGVLAASLLGRDLLARVHNEPVWFGPRFSAVCVIMVGLSVIASIILHFCMSPLLVQLTDKPMTSKGGS